MLIHDMSKEECLGVLARSSVGRLGCTQDNQAYVVPIYFVSNDRYIYAISAIGKKIEFMRANPLVCLKVDEILSHDDWTSVIVFGRYEELPNRLQYEQARAEALELFTRRSAWWWQPAFVCNEHRDTPHSCAPVTYRIHIDQLTGRHAIPYDVVANATVVKTRTNGERFREFLRRIKIAIQPTAGSCFNAILKIVSSDIAEIVTTEGTEFLLRNFPSGFAEPPLHVLKAYAACFREEKQHNDELQEANQ